MKNWLLGFSLLMVVLCGFLLLEKDREAAAARARAAAAEIERESLAQEAARQERLAKNLRSELHETRAQALESAPERTTARPDSTLSGPAGKERRNPFFRDPQMRKAIEDEAREGIAKNVEALFHGGLAQQLQLNEDQSATLKQLLTRRAAMFWEKMLLPMMTGEIAEADMAANGRALRQDYEDNQAQLRALLGDRGFDTYEWFDKTQSARDDFKRAQSEIAKTGQGLTEDQANQLLAAMVDERASFKMRYDPGDPSQMDLDHWYSNFTEDKLEVCGADLEALNDRIVQRAQALLTPEQTDALKELLAKQLLRGKFVVRSTTAMFANQR